jgi:hypothetical protein
MSAETIACNSLKGPGAAVSARSCIYNSQSTHQRLAPKKSTSSSPFKMFVSAGKLMAMDGRGNRDRRSEIHVNHVRAWWKALPCTRKRPPEVIGHDASAKLTCPSGDGLQQAVRCRPADGGRQRVELTVGDCSRTGFNR